MEITMRDVPFTVRVKSYDVGGWKRDGDSYLCEGQGLRVDVKLCRYEGTGAYRQVNTITNIGEQDVLLSGFSSAYINTCRGDVAVGRNRWQAEGQWQFFSYKQCGLVPATIHPWERETYTISSVGSWSTGVFFPLTMMIGEKYTYYMSVEGAHNWQLTHSVMGSMKSPQYTLEGTAAHEENGGWTYLLKSGESYTAQPAVFGCVEGGFEEAAGELVRYYRAVNLAHYPDGHIPVVFNDYMNCLWGDPSDKKLLPLIDAAASVGCEYFCIDAGWHKNVGQSANGGWSSGCGDWIPDNAKFGDKGLKGIFDYMYSRGLKPGVWFELDTVNSNAAAYNLDDDCLLKRYGSVIPRAFFNFSNEKVRRHLHERIDALYSMGVRYIKNDYNQTTGIGCDNDGSAPAEGLVRNYLAFSSFIDEVRADHPDLIIENCGSGACRSDNGTLSHFHLQSTSDQEFYYLYPSVIIGSMAQLAPEKAGIWSYPCPLLYEEIKDFSGSDEWRARFADGEETIFNMVNGMCGVLYQSGRLDYADEYNLGLVRDGVAAYKRMRGDVMNSHPIMPTGMMTLGDTGFAAAGLETEDRSRAYLAVWRVDGEGDSFTVDLKKYGYNKATAWYPESTVCEMCDSKLTVKLPKKYSARMVLLEK